MTDSLRPQYHFRRVGAQTHIWDVRTLIEQIAELPIIEVPLAEIAELDEAYWFDMGGAVPTCRAIADHMILAQKADLSYPILLCAEGRVMDGMHRVVKSVTLGHKTITAKRLAVTPPPDYVDVAADDLPY